MDTIILDNKNRELEIALLHWLRHPVQSLLLSVAFAVFEGGSALFIDTTGQGGEEHNLCVPLAVQKKHIISNFEDDDRIAAALLIGVNAEAGSIAGLVRYADSWRLSPRVYVGGQRIDFASYSSCDPFSSALAVAEERYPIAVGSDGVLQTNSFARIRRR